MVTKEEVEARVEEGSSTLFHAGVSLHRALMDIETQHFEDSIDDLVECRGQLEYAIETYRVVIDHARQGLAENTALPSEPDRAELFFENLYQKAQLEGFFYDDPDLWSYLESSAIQNEYLSAYVRFVSLLSQLRDHVAGLVTDIERGAGAQHIQRGTWRTMTLYTRATNFGHMIAFVNSEVEQR